jgi:REP element-mobilizing transposase RayT
MNNSFAAEESRCEFVFQQLGPCWHLYTPENHPVILVTKEDYRTAMTLLAICALSFPSVRIITFQWMSNHLHITLAGPEKDIAAMFAMLRKYLGNYLASKGRPESLKGWGFKLRLIESLSDIRNVIAYNNRNGFLVHRDSTPFTYPWGGNRFFFNPDAKQRFKDCRDTIPKALIRERFHTHKFDGFAGKPFMDGLIPPPAFCYFASSEGLFRNARHYFSLISRNIESMKAIAKEIGESVFYTDDDLYSILLEICREHYDAGRPTLLPAQAKLEVARKLHYEYNASVKQISRMLKLNLSLLEGILASGR